MLRLKVRPLLLAAVLLVLGPLIGYAQFDRREAFSQQYNATTVKEKKDTSDKLFSFPEYFGGLGHKRETRGARTPFPGFSPEGP